MQVEIMLHETYNVINRYLEKKGQKTVAKRIATITKISWGKVFVNHLFNKGRTINIVERKKLSTLTEQG